MMTSQLRVLVVYDGAAIPSTLRAGLSNQGYQVTEVRPGTPVLDLIRAKTTDLVLLDVGRRDIDGIQIIQRARECDPDLPIIVLSDCGAEADKVSALDAGADDYLTKSFGICELLARIRAAQRHRLQQGGETPVFHCGDLKVDLVRRRVTIRDRLLRLSPREYGLLRLLVTHAGKVVTHQQILRNVWGHDTDVQYIRIYIGALRKKLEVDIEHPWYIMTELRVGYRLRSQCHVADNGKSG